MSSIDRPTEKELAQAFFYDLIRDPGAQPDPALDSETARLIRELVLAERASTRQTGAGFAAVRQRIRRNLQPPATGEMVGTGGQRWPGPVLNESEPGFTRQGGGFAWNKFLALAGMAATIVLVVGLLVLSLAAVRPHDTATPARGASPASIPTVAVQPTPSPTVQPKPTAKTGGDLLNPKVFLEQALVDAAKSLSLDPILLQKQLQSGLSLAEIAKKQGVDLTSLKAIMLDSFKTQIDAEKNSGLLTQDQAAQLLKTSSAFIDDFMVSQASPNVVKLTPTPEKKG